MKKTVVHYKNDLAVLSPGHGGITVVSGKLFASPLAAIHYYITQDKELREKLIGTAGRSSCVHLVRKNKELFNYNHPKLRKIIKVAYDSYLAHPYLQGVLSATKGDIVYSEDWERKEPSVLGVNSIGEGRNLIGQILKELRDD